MQPTGKFLPFDGLWVARIVIVGEFTEVPLAVGQKEVHSGVVDVLGQSFPDVYEFVDSFPAQDGNDFVGRVLLAPSAVGLVNALAVERVLSGVASYFEGERCRGLGRRLDRGGVQPASPRDSYQRHGR